MAAAFRWLSDGGNAGFARATEPSQSKTAEASQHHSPSRSLGDCAADVDEYILIVIVIQIPAVGQIFPTDIFTCGTAGVGLAAVTSVA
jgi:hypothetical protein